MTLCEPNFTIGPEAHFVMALINLIAGKVLASAFVGGCAVVFVLRAIKAVKDRRDSNRIYKVLRQPNHDGNTFRSSETISGITNLTQSRISELCNITASFTGKTFPAGIEPTFKV